MSSIKYNLIILLSLVAMASRAQVVSLNFNSSDESWVGTAGSGDTYWEWGDPTGTEIDDDNSGGGNAWVMGISGDFNVQEFDDIYLTSGSYDLSSFTEGYVSLAINYDLGTFNDGFDDYPDLMTFQYSTDNANWSTLGSLSSGNNWYNVDDFGNQGWGGNSGGWLTAAHDLPADALGEATVYFRLFMFTNSPTGTYGSEGFAMDDFQLFSSALPSNEAEILTFSISEEVFAASIDSVARTVNAFVASGTDVSSLTPTFTISTSASADIASGVPRDFTNEVVYTITAEDGSMTDWTVAVSTPSPGISLFPKSGIEGTEVFIYGRGFSTTAAENTVLFGGVNATVSAASANRLTVSVPTGASTGINEIAVSSNGFSYSTEPNFTVVASGLAGDFLDYKQSDFDLGISKAVSLEVADYDADGDLDLAYDSDATLYIATIQDGSIVSTVSVATGRSVTSSTLLLETVDVNKDGFPDIVAGGARLGWFKNNGDGTWSDENVISSSEAPEALRVFDVDGDFDDDIVAEASGSVGIYKNSGSESFNAEATSLTKLGIPIDWDEDGDIDMVAYGEDDMTFQESVILLSNDGTGKFTNSTLATTTLTSIKNVDIGDLNNDGNLDFVYVDLDEFGTGENSIGYMLNNGDGTFASPVAFNTTTTSQTDKKLKLGDLNGDGFLDIARTTDDGFGNGWFYIYLSSSSLSYSQTQLDGSIAGQDVELIDINNDGDLDILQESSQSGGYFPLYVQGVSDLNIASFSFAEQTGAAAINSTAFTVDIEVSSSADLATLAPTIGLASDAVFINPASGVANDFSSAATYTVRTVDGSSSTQQDWTVTVTQVPDVPTGLSTSTEQTSSEIGWTQANAASGYEIELSSNDTDFTTLVSGFDPLSIGSGATVSADLTGLTEGTSYYLRMRSINSNGTYSGYSDTLNIITKPADPVLADISTSEIGQDTIALTWGPVSGVVDSYSVEIALSNTFATLLTGYPVDTTATKFVLGSDGGTSPLTENTTYYARITANNATGSSGYSNTISILTKPETPVVNEVDLSGVEQIEATVSWNDVFSGSGSYVIEVSSTDFDETETLLSGYPLIVSTNSEVVGTTVGTDALQPATNYWVRVRSTNTSGESPNSNVVSFLTKAADPVLTEVAQADIGQTTINLSWDAVDGADDYNIELALSETFASLLDGYPVNTTSNGLVIGDDGGPSLDENTTYYIRVASSNATGSSGYSNIVSVLTKPETPVVGAVDVSLVDQTQATLSWNDVFSGSGSYVVEVSSTDFDEAATLLSGYPLTVTTNSEVVGSATGTAALEPATNYWVRVRSTNASGESPNSNVVSFLTKAADPVLTDVTQADIGQTTINLSWDAVDGADDYNIELALSETFASVLAGYPANTATNEFIIGNDGGTSALAENTTYYIRIVSNNATGSSGYSNTIAVLTKPETPVVSTVDVSVTEQTQATISWNDVFSGSGSYVVEVSSTDFDEAATLLSGYPLTVTTNSEVVGSATGTAALEPATNYWVRVRSTNASGESPNSNVVSFLTKAADPVLTDVTQADIGQTTINLSWDAVDGADDYNIELALSETFASVLAGYPANTATNEFIIGNDGGTSALAENTTYYIRIVSNNATGSSGYSNTIAVLTKPETPVVSTVDVSVTEQTQATISWNDVFSGSGSYVVEVSSTDFDEAVTLLSGYPLTVTTNSEVVGTAAGTAALEPATTYWVRVRSTNASGESVNSNVVNFLTKAADPVLTDVTQADIGQTTINLSWDAVSGADDYSVEVSTSSTFSSLLNGYPAIATSNAFAIGSDAGTSALVENTIHYIRITSNNATGSSNYSNTVSVLTKPETPVVSTVGLSSIGQTQAIISWNDVFSGSGSYVIEVSSTDFEVAETLLAGYPLTVSSNSEVVGTAAGTEVLETAANYWARVRSTNASGESENSNVVSFLTLPADPVALAASDVATESFTANWEVVDGADSYTIQVTTDDKFTNLIVNQATADNFYSVTGLSAGLEYFYQVIATNATGDSEPSPIISVTTNSVPTSLEMDNQTIDENQTVGSIVGTFLITDDPGDTHTFSFINGTGDTDNGSFTIDGSDLISGAVYDHENKPSYSVRVQATDQLGAISQPQSFTITINDVNDAPSAISVDTSPYDPRGYDIEGTNVADLFAEDQDEDAITFSILAGSESFALNTNSTPNRLITAKVFENEVDSVLSVTIQADDGKGGVLSQEFDITINAFVDTEAPRFTETLVNPTSFVIGANYDSLALRAEIEDFRIQEVVLYKRLLTESEFTTLTLSELPDQPGVYVDSVGQDDLGIAGIEYYFLAMDEAGNSSIWSSGREFAPQKMGLVFPEDGEGAPVVESVTKFGRTIDSYQIISIPFVFDNANSRTVGTLFDEYGGEPDNRTWRIIRYNNATGELDNLNETSQIEPGEGYFFIAQREERIIIENAKINTEDPFNLELKQGWNLIGNPYNLDIDFDAVIANNNAEDIVERLRVLDTENSETWPASPVLRSLEGGFVFASEDFTLQVRYTDAFLSFGGRVAEEESEAEWFLPITLEQNGDIRKGGIGMDRNAKVSFDTHDEVVLPRWLKFLEINFKHEGDKFSELNKDVVPFTASYTWDFEVASSADGVSKLTWGEESMQVVNLKLYNTATGEVIDMTKQTSYEFLLEEPVKFKLLYSEDPNDTFDFKELEIMDAYPNPFVQSFKVPLLLPPSAESYDVSVSLMDLSGRVILNGQLEESYGGSLKYEMQRPAGMSPGMYLYQVKIANTRTRKIITKRIRVQ